MNMQHAGPAFTLGRRKPFSAIDPLVRFLSSRLFFACLIAPLAPFATAGAVGHPDGFAKGVTGGGDLSPVHPENIAALRTALCDQVASDGRCTDVTPRVIEIGQTFDFTGTVLRDGDARRTEPGCIVRQCGPGQQRSHPVHHDRHEPGWTFAPFTDTPPEVLAQCRTVLGRNCVPNDAVSSGADYRPLDAQALAAFGTLDTGIAHPMSAQEAARRVPAESGVGVVDAR